MTELLEDIATKVYASFRAKRWAAQSKAAVQLRHSRIAANKALPMEEYLYGTYYANERRALKDIFFHNVNVEEYFSKYPLIDQFVMNCPSNDLIALITFCHAHSFFSGPRRFIDAVKMIGSNGYNASLIEFF